ncbi:hypothetical protein ACS3SW_19675 [Roseobacteraceae bacterium S113]
MTLAIVFFILFAASGIAVSMRGQRNTELWLVIPPVFLAIAMGAWRAFSGDPSLGLILSGMLVVFSASAAGALIGLGAGRAWAARRT